MNVFIFASTSIRNIEIGIEQKKWAVAPTSNPQVAAGRLTRALQMPVKSAGIFYCSNPQVFTVPFRIESIPKNEIISDVWDKSWCLPFDILPIGDISHQITLSQARVTWPVLQGGVNPSHVLHFSGSRAFAATRLRQINWDMILEQLQIEVDEYEDFFLTD